VWIAATWQRRRFIVIFMWSSSGICTDFDGYGLKHSNSSLKEGESGKEVEGCTAQKSIKGAHASWWGIDCMLWSVYHSGHLTVKSGLTVLSSYGHGWSSVTHATIFVLLVVTSMYGHCVHEPILSCFTSSILKLSIQQAICHRLHRNSWPCEE